MDRAPSYMPPATLVDPVDEAALRLAAQDWAALHRLVLEQRAIFDNAPVGIVITEPHQLRSFNPRSEEMFGIPRSEVAGMSTKEVFLSPDAFKELTREAGVALVKDGFFERAEQQFRRRDGTTFWARLRACALDPADLVAGTIWIIEDVTETREARQEIEAIMTNAAIGIVFTRQRLIHRVNPAFCTMSGYTQQELLGEVVRIVYPDDASFAEHGAEAYPVLMRGESFRSQRTMLRKDGERLWVQMIGYQVSPGEPEKGTIWMVEDRTREKADEESLREALLHNRAILENAVLGIAVVEAGRTLHCNRKMEELFRAAPGAMEGIMVRTLYPDYTSWSTARTMSAMQFSHGQIHMAEHEMVRLDGTRFWARLSGRPFDLDDASGRSVWMVDDVTARREAVNAVVRARDELELRVAERTAELAGANALLQDEINERRQAEARVHHMAYHDSLTGLPNRALLQERLQDAMDTLAASGGDGQLALMFIDLDRFKNINDSLGHLVGDELLRQVALWLVDAVRDGDMVARLGGDEFVVLLPTIDSQTDCQQVSERIIEALAQPCHLEGRRLHITPSIGICLYPDHGSKFETLMRNADAAMYQAKAAGRNNYQFFSEQFNLAAARHFELESNLRGALARDEFELHYQPVIATAERRLIGFEVLLRWLPRSGDGKLIGPSEFIPILEETGMIVAIGEWVLRSACKKLKWWQRQGLPVVPLAVNLSARQFMHHGLVKSIADILDETGIEPSLIELEITETALMQHGGQTLEVLRQITAMGISLSIDDFGTGYSSLAYLKRFPVRKIKIDRAFVRELEASAEDRAIVAAVMALANSLQLQVVAEGVETEGQFALLRELGCQYAQGYLFARPLPAQQARAILAEQNLTQSASP